ncbi:MAG: acetylxylan esterase [Bacteroidaceae bacterium]|nr:acetylxylan esterase [Candidatus Colenecus caballi]MCQ2073450.1 acetylxylan esterase [Bacteroidaceae bacterium]
MNRNFKSILAFSVLAVLCSCASKKAAVEEDAAQAGVQYDVAPDRIANRNVEYDQYFVELDENAAPATPDEKGFIRRWSLLEPINKPNSGNTVFTDSYILAELTKEYFPGQFANAAPVIGSTVEVESEAPRAGGRGFGGFGGQQQAQPAAPATVKQTLKWHAIDSKLFNIKLIRFAKGVREDKNGYGLIFNAVTVINCDQDMTVFLAAGSNASSIWWVNGEKVLTLQADRRMVADDGMSQRITLKKGKNIVRAAVINGPGMSDMCCRFYNEDGSIVKNITITNK